MTVSVRPGAERVARRLAEAAADRRRRRDDARDEAERTRVPDRLRPTRQTEQRLQPDPVLLLHRAGKITDAQRDAALEIRQAYYDAASAVMARSARWDGGRGGGLVNRAEHDTVAQVARRQRYVRWARSAARIGGSLQVTIDILVDGRGMRVVERERRWRNGRATVVLIGALRHYAQLAGWEQMA